MSILDALNRAAKIPAVNCPPDFLAWPEPSKFKVFITAKDESGNLLTKCQAIVFIDIRSFAYPGGSSSYYGGGDSVFEVSGLFTAYPNTLKACVSAYRRKVTYGTAYFDVIETLGDETYYKYNLEIVLPISNWSSGVQAFDSTLGNSNSGASGTIDGGIDLDLRRNMDNNLRQWYYRGGDGGGSQQSLETSKGFGT